MLFEGVNFVSVIPSWLEPEVAGNVSQADVVLGTVLCIGDPSVNPKDPGLTLVDIPVGQAGQE